MGVLNRPDAQVVFVDTPGIHKPRTALGDAAQRHRAGHDRRRRRRVLRARRHPALRPRRPVGRRASCPKDAVLRRQQGRQGVARTQVAEQLVAAADARAQRVLPGVGHAPATASTPSSSTSIGRLPEGPAVLPRRHGHRRARGVLGGRARARAAAAPHPRRAAALDRRPRHRVGLAAASAARSSSSATARRAS